MKGCCFQAKDISDFAFFNALDAECTRKRLELDTPSPWVFTWELERSPWLAGLPLKVIVAKAASLIRRGLLDGCTCGCRGDFERTTKSEVMR
jgi:hypothetical protein